MMNEIRFYASLFRRRLGWFLLAVLTVTSIGLAVAITLPPIYAAKARLVVESEKIPDELAASTVQTKALEHLQIIQQRILSRDSLLDIATRLRVYGDNRPAPDQVVMDMRSRITLDITGGQPRPRDPVNATILIVGFEAETAVMAAAVANEIVTRVMSEDIEMRTTVARQTLEFFDQEAARLGHQLNQSGAALLAFQQENLDLLPETRALRETRLAAIEAELTRIERDSSDLRRERDRLTRLHQSVRQREGGDPVGFETRQLAALQETLNSLPAGDPGIADVEARIASLTRRIEAAGGDTAKRTAYHRHRDEIDERLAIEDARRVALGEELEGLRIGMSLAPAKAAELASLQRAHENLRTLYEQAMESKALAETGDAIETLSKGQRIAVIEQASIPRTPDRPNRKLLAMVSLAGGVMLGLMIVIVMELRLGFLRRPVDLERRLGITPIATLPLIDIPDMRPVRTGRSLQRKLCVATALVIVFAVGGAILSGHLPGPSELAAHFSSDKTL